MKNKYRELQDRIIKKDMAIRGTNPSPVIEVELPLPPEGLFANTRIRNRFGVARLVKKARGDASTIARIYAPKVPYEKVAIRAEFFMPRKRDGDNLNAWLKHYIDGLQDAGIVKNDSGVVLLPPIQTTGNEAGRKVVLRIQQIV